VSCRAWFPAVWCLVVGLSRV